MYRSIAKLLKVELKHASNLKNVISKTEISESILVKITVCSTYLEIRYRGFSRSEEHTSELQPLAYLVCRLLLEKKKSY